MRTSERVIRSTAAAFATHKRGGEVSARRTRCARLRAFVGASIIAIAAIGCTPEVASQQTPGQIPTSGAYTVVTVIDGDTLDAESPAGDLERIRLLGIVH